MEENNENTTETSEEQTQVETTGGLTEGLEQKETTNADIPEGLDAEIFDAETRTFKESAVAERLKHLNEQVESYKKQATDMRRKLSKGVDAPAKVEDYDTNYKFEDRYEFLTGDESNNATHVKDVLKSLDNFAFDHGLSVETAKDLKNMYLQYAEEVSIIDGRSDEEKEQARAEFITEQKKLLGDQADTIIKENLKFFKEYGFFNDDEKKALLGAMDKSAVWNSIGLKFRKLFGQNTSADIPVRGVVVSGLADDRTLAREYYDNATTDSRRMEILQQRIDAGRSGGLPMPE